MEKIEEVIALGIPTILLVGRRRIHFEVSKIDVNNTAVGTMAATYFLDRGFKNFAYIGYDQMPWSQDRCNHFAKTMSDAGFETHIYKQQRSKKMRLWENEQTIMAKWLESLPKPIAVMTCNDDRGLEATEACRLASLNVPEQVAILGVENDQTVCNLSYPALSSVALNLVKAGYETAALLEKLINTQDNINTTILIEPIDVVTRQSTDMLAIEDAHVAKAVTYIRQNFSKLIQVNDVADAVGLSRRTLERKFRKSLGCSVLTQIRKVRAGQAAQMLVETNWPITRIVSALGFNGQENFSRFFKKEKNMRPSDYRKRFSREN
jgi:LacI family transcriptional regulator